MIGRALLPGVTHPEDRGTWEFVGYLLHRSSQYTYLAGWTIDLNGHPTARQQLRRKVGKIPLVIAATPVWADGSESCHAFRILGLDGQSYRVTEVGIKNNNFIDDVPVTEIFPGFRQDDWSPFRPGMRFFDAGRDFDGDTMVWMDEEGPAFIHPQVGREAWRDRR